MRHNAQRWTRPVTHAARVRVLNVNLVCAWLALGSVALSMGVWQPVQFHMLLAFKLVHHASDQATFKILSLPLE